jgi:hypothetical protein
MPSLRIQIVWIFDKELIAMVYIIFWSYALNLICMVIKNEFAEQKNMAKLAC